MNTIHRFGYTLVLLFSVGLIAQNKGPQSSQNLLTNNSPEFEQNTNGALYFKRENISLHLSSENLSPKDVLFFTAYVFTGPNQVRTTDSETLKVELLDSNGNLLQRQRHKIEDGLSHGSFKIPKRIPEGEYYVRAYTQWLLNYGPETFPTRNIKISSSKDRKKKFDFPDMVGAFPEGGHLVANLNQRVVVQFPEALPKDLKVYDSQGSVVANVTPYKAGLGTFFIEPESEETYILKGTGIETLPLPEVQKEGYTMHLSNLKVDELLLRIAASDNLKESSLTLSGILDGVSFFEQKLDFEDKNMLEIRIPKKNIPTGVSQLQLKDDLGKIWAERFFYNQDKSLKIQVNPLASEKGNVSYSVKVTDANNVPVEGTFSVGLRTTANFSELDNESIFSDANLRNQRYWDDLLAVTGESSNFLKVNKNFQIPALAQYDFQKGLDFYGRAFDLNQSLLTNTKIQVLIWTKNEVIAEEVTTNVDGLFKLSGLDYEGSIKMAFRTEGKSSKTKLVRVIPYEMETPPLIDNKKELEASEKLAFANAQQRLKGPDGDVQPLSADENIVSLNEVILEKKQDHKKLTPSVYSIQPSVVRYQDPEKPKTIPQLFLGIPGVQISNLGDLYPTITLFKATGAGPVLWVLDGLPLIQPTSLVQIMNIVNYTDIERIELLTGPQGSIYGVRGAGGVIAIYTKDGNENGYVDRKEAQLQYEGYHESMDFASYERQVSKKIRQSEGQAATVYWNPVLKTNESGEAIITFPKPKDVNALDVEIWGATPDGKRGTFQGSKSLDAEIGI